MPALIWAWREGIWPCAGLQHLAHHHVLDLLGRDLGALERGADGDAAEVGRVQRGQAAAHLADGRSGAAEDDGAVRHSESDLLGFASALAGSQPGDVSRTRCAPKPPPPPLPTPAPTRSRSGTSRASRSPTTSTGGLLQALVDSGEAKPALRKLAVTHAGGKRYVLAGLGTREAFDAERARVAAAAVVGPRARARHAQRCAGSSRTTSATPRPAGSSRARCSPRTAYRRLQVRARRGRRARAARAVRPPRRLRGRRPRARSPPRPPTPRATSSTRRPTR